jgi:hypothetical protein
MFALDYYLPWLGGLVPQRDRLSRLEVRYDPRDISHIYIRDPETREFRPVARRDWLITPTTLWEHQANRVARRGANARSNAEKVTLRRRIAEIAGGQKLSKADLREAVRRIHTEEAAKPYEMQCARRLRRRQSIRFVRSAACRSRIGDMADHLLDHVRPYLDRSVEDRIAYVRAPRWIGHHVAIRAHERLAELLSWPPALRTRGLILVGPYAIGKTMIADRFAVEHLRAAERQRVWAVQTREGAGLAYFYGSILQAVRAPSGNSRDVGRKAEQIDHLLGSLNPRILIFDEFHNALRGRARDVEAVLAFLRRIGRQFDISPVLIGEVAV